MHRHRFVVASAVLVSLTVLPSARAQYVVTDALFPKATGTVSFMPELVLLQMPVLNDIQSGYFRTTAVNRDFRRGFLEYLIPDFDGTLVSATLLLTDDHALIAAPRPPDRHELGYYDADLVVNTDDYDVATSTLADFETDANSAQQTYSFDLTAVVDAYRGRNLGLRIKLAVDPDYFGLGSAGSGFQNNVQGDPPRLVLVRSGATEPLGLDADEDGVADTQDNCTRVPNPTQCDSDGDGYGNHCDGDLGNDGGINAQDGVILRNLLGAGTPGPVFNIGDLNCNGYVNAQDMALFRRMLGNAPGPSGLAP